MCSQSGGSHHITKEDIHSTIEKAKTCL